MKTRHSNATLLLALAIGVSFLVQIGCASNRFSTGAHFDTSYDFAAVHSFAFDVARAKMKASANGQILEEALRKALVGRGFVEKTKADADVLLSYDLGAYAAAAVSGRSSMAKRDGGITVWVYDRKTGDQIWYGWSERPLSPEDQPEPVINDAVDAIFQGRMPQNQ
jgi:hypothetical protein